MIKGSHHSVEANEKNRASHLGKHLSPHTEFKKGMTPWHKGTKGVKPAPKNAFKKGHRPANKGLFDGSNKRDKRGRFMG